MKKEEKSLCLKNNKYRFRKGKLTAFHDKPDLDFMNKVMRSDNEHLYKFYPYKPYWFYRLRFKYDKYIKPMVRLNIQSKRHMTIVVFMIITILCMFYIAYLQGIF